ncbi:MAG: hypothetical protein AAF387_22435 [Pseudomonadota bacterium]
MTRIFTSLALLGFVTTVSAEGFMPWTKVTEMADLNDDGMITMFEVERFKPVAKFPGFQPWMADHFNDLDANNDGMVDATELAKAKEMFDMDDTALSQAFFKRQGFMPRNQ